MNTEYKMHCPNCSEKLAIMPVLRTLNLDCKLCGFFCMLKSDTNENSFELEYQLEIPLNKEVLETFKNFENLDEARPKLFCPFCKENMQFVQKENNFYLCDKCKRSFFPEYS